MSQRLNIVLGSPDWRGYLLSNLAQTPFIVGQYRFPSVESALQGIKFADLAERERVFALEGLKALRAGRRITTTIGDGGEHFVYWQNEVLRYHSTEHRLLIALFIGEKVRQNPEVQRALLATEGSFIFHDTGHRENPQTSLPERFYIEILLTQRRLLRKLETLHR